MAAEIKKDFGIETTLTPGGRGVFDVVVDGTTVYSKSKTDRFPAPGEVTQAIKSTISGS